MQYACVYTTNWQKSRGRIKMAAKTWLIIINDPGPSIVAQIASREGKLHSKTRWIPFIQKNLCLMIDKSINLFKDEYDGGAMLVRGERWWWWRQWCFLHLIYISAAVKQRIAPDSNFIALELRIFTDFFSLISRTLLSLSLL